MEQLWHWTGGSINKRLKAQCQISGGFERLFGVKKSRPLVSVQSAAVSMAFSSGSPTSWPSSRVTSEWHVATTRWVSTGISDTGITSFPSLRDTRGIKYDSGFTARVLRPHRTIFLNCAALYLNPATPRTTKLSLVNVPVLSKQQISTFPAKGILKGSVQNTSGKGTQRRTRQTINGSALMFIDLKQKYGRCWLTTWCWKTTKKRHILKCFKCMFP